MKARDRHHAELLRGLRTKDFVRSISRLQIDPQFCSKEISSPSRRGAAATLQFSTARGGVALRRHQISRDRKRAWEG